MSGAAMTEADGQELRTLKLILVGEEGVGKTTFARRHLQGEREKWYIATQGAEVRPLKFHTSRGWIQFNVWDTALRHGYGGRIPLMLRDGFYKEGHCAVIMFDVTSRKTYEQIAAWHQAITAVCGDIPIALIGNKADIKEREVMPRDVDFHHKGMHQYFDVSAKSNYNYTESFLWLAKALLGDPDLELRGVPELQPPKVQMDLAVPVQSKSDLEERTNFES